jgi:hypothetical protein
MNLKKTVVNYAKLLCWTSPRCTTEYQQQRSEHPAMQSTFETSTSRMQWPFIAPQTGLVSFLKTPWFILREVHFLSFSLPESISLSYLPTPSKHPFVQRDCTAIQNICCMKIMLTLGVAYIWVQPQSYNGRTISVYTVLSNRNLAYALSC